MKTKIATVLLALALQLSGLPASTLLNISFDKTGAGGTTSPGNAAAPYNPSGSDIVSGTGTLIQSTSASIPQVVTSTGTEGGLALSSTGNGAINTAYNSGYNFSGVAGSGVTGITMEVILNVQKVGGTGLQVAATLGAGGWFGFSGDNLEFSPFNAGAGDAVLFDYSAYFGQWTTIEAVWNGTAQTNTLFINGVQVASATDTTNTTMNFSGLDVGYHHDYGLPINGLLDAVAFSNAALAPGDFVLVVPEPGTTAMLFAGGFILLVGYCGRKSSLSVG